MTPASSPGPQHRLPDMRGLRRRHEHLEAVLAGVAGARDRDAHAGDFAGGEPVVLHLRQRHRRERLQHVERGRPLQRQQRVPVARVHGRGVGELGHLAADPGVVLLDVRRVDDQQEVVVGQAIHEQVVDERAGWRRERGVVDLPDGEARGVVGGDLLDGRQRVGAGDLDLAHVAHVEQAGPRPDGHVLVGDPGILDGHVPAAERHHASLVAEVRGVQRGLLEGGLGVGHAVKGAVRVDRNPSTIQPQGQGLKKRAAPRCWEAPCPSP